MKKYGLGGPIAREEEICHFCGSEGGLDTGFECTDCGADNIHIYFPRYLADESQEMSPELYGKLLTIRDEIEENLEAQRMSKVHAVLRWLDSSVTFWVALSFALLLLWGVARE